MITPRESIVNDLISLRFPGAGHSQEPLRTRMNSKEAASPVTCSFRLRGGLGLKGARMEDTGNR